MNHNETQFVRKSINNHKNMCCNKLIIGCNIHVCNAMQRKYSQMVISICKLYLTPLKENRILLLYI